VVVCGDKLALVALSISDWGSLVFFHLDGLDSLTEPPRWSPVPELDGAVFISGAEEGQMVFEDRHGRWVLSSARPERWEGEKQLCRLLPSWVSPSVLSLDG
jgi:hypothetical protein